MVRSGWKAMTAAATLMTGTLLTSAQDPAAPATQPADDAATQPDRESTYDRLLGGGNPADRPLMPVPRPGTDLTTGGAAVKPGAPSLPTRREGSYIVNQTGRLSRSTDGSGWDFVFSADGAALQDPPMKVLPNLKLMGMETQIETLGMDLQFRVTGMVTEYRGRNYILFEKVIVVQNDVK